MKKRFAVLIFFGFFAVYCFSNKALGATDWTVNSSVRLSSAVANSVSGDIITITTNTIVISETIPSVANKALTIKTDNGMKILLDGSGNKGFLFSNGSNVSIDETSFKNFLTEDFGGAIINENSSMTIGSGVSFLLNAANLFGGAIYNTSGSTMTIGDSVVFSSNSADIIGGAIINENSSMTIGDSAFFSLNTTFSGGGIYNTWNSSMTIGSGAVFSSNTASQSGGAVYNLASVLNIGSNTVFSSNISQAFDGTFGGGGAIVNTDNAVMKIDTGTLFSSNTTGDNGGAIYNFDRSTVTIGSETKFFSNTATRGGAIFNGNYSVIEIGEGGKFFFNETETNYGGAIYNTAISTVTIGENAIFSLNAANRGGAIHNTSTSTMIIGDGILFSSNTANRGGAIYNEYNSFAEIGERAKFLSNEAETNYGGAIYNTAISTVTIGDGAVFSLNTATRGGAIYNTSNSVITIGNNAQFSSNTANRGGAIHNTAISTVAIGENAIFSLNTANRGGAINNENNSFIDIGDGAKFFSNEAERNHGGAIYNYSGSAITITEGAVFTSNTATINGGAIYNDSTSEDISAMIIGNNAEFSYNTAISSGGAIHNVAGSSMTIGNNAIFSSNTATSGDGGAIYTNSHMEIGSQANFFANKARSGGAMYLENIVINLENPLFSNNTATSKGGAVYITGDEQTKGEMNISVTRNTEIKGNKAGMTDNAFYLEKNADLNLDIESGVTMTLKDGVVSEDDNTAITKTGNGVLSLGSENNRIDGILNIFGGEIKTANSIGSGKIYFDNSALLHITGDMEMGNEIYAKIGGVQDIMIETDENKILTIDAITGAGSETFIKNGSGSIIFDTASSVNLAKTNLTAGTLRVLTEDYVSSNVEIADTATLGGTGKITGDVINNGTLRPGGESSIGTLTIDGDYTENGILGVRLYYDEVPTNDLLLVSGNADINTASKIDLDLREGFQVGDIYTILTASSGINGIYGGLKNNLSSFDIEISSDENNVYLQFKDVDIDYNELTGLSHNQREISGAIDKIADTSDIDKLSKIIGTIEMSDDAGKKDVFDEIAGSIYANMLYSSADNSGRRQIYNQIEEKVSRKSDDKKEEELSAHNLWGEVYGSHMQRGSDENSVNKFKDNSVYMMIGYDNYYDDKNMILGYMAQFGKHTGKQGADEFSMNDYKGGVYLGTFGEKWNLKSALTVGYQQYEADREQKLLQSQTEAEYNGYSFGASADLYYKAYEAQEWKFSLSPFAGLEGNFVHTDKFTEKAKGNVASWLDVKANNFLIADAKLGVRAEKISKLSWYAELSGKCNFAGTKGTFEAKINGIGEDVEIYGAENGIISGRLEAGLDLKIGKNFDVFVVGVCEQGDKVGRYSGHLGVNYGW